ncbi:unnamed protein product, partial [Symbiodinium sp. CCMP2592]
LEESSPVGLIILLTSSHGLNRFRLPSLHGSALSPHCTGTSTCTLLSNHLANRLQRGKQHKGRRTREAHRPEESVAAAKAGPGPAPSGSSSSGTTFKVLVLAPRRFIRLFEAHPPYLAGTPGVILPDDIPGTPLSTTTAPLAGQTTCKVMLIPGLAVHICTSPQVPPPALAPTQVDGREDSDRTARPTVQIHSDSDTDEEDVVVLLPGPGGQAELPEVIHTASSLEPPASSSSQCTLPASGPEKRRQLLANVVMRAAEDGSLAKALSRVRWPESEDAPPGHTDSESDTVEALEPGDGLPPPSPENILRADPAASTLLSHTFQGISPPENMLESVREMVKLLPASVASQDPPSTCQPLPTRRWRRRQLSQLEAEAEAHAKADPPTVTLKGLPIRSPFSPITRTDTKRVRPEKRSSTSSSNDDSSSGRSGSLGAVHGQWSFCVALSLQRCLLLPASCHAHQWSPQQAMLLPPSRFSPQPHAGASFSGPWHLFASGQPVVPLDTVLRNLVHRLLPGLQSLPLVLPPELPLRLRRSALQAQPTSPSKELQGPKPDRSKLPSDIPTTPSWFASDPDEVRASDSDQIDREMAARGLPPPPVPPLCENDEPRGPPPPRPVRYDDAPGPLSEPEGPCIPDSSSLLSLVAAANSVGYQDVAPSDAHATGIKRAYNRAVRRAQASPLQGTFYRGRWCSFRAPVLSPQPRLDRRPQLHAAAPASAARLLHVSYTAGGLTGESYQELMQWLAQLPSEQCPMIVHIQETHWSHDQEYSTPGWHIISSACSSPKAGGLLTLVSDQLCSASQISSSSRVAGRLLHVRIDLGDRTVDAINTYQKVYHSGSTRIEKGQTQTAADQRMGVWMSLRGLLKEIPIRHHLILSGDFNSPAPLISELVGSKARAFRTPMVPDLAAFEALLVDFQLLHLNSWTRRAGPTFLSSQGASQIDHVFVRKATADMPARGGSPCDWPLAAWRQGGRHRPVRVSLPIRPYRALGKSQPERALLDLQGLRNACRDPSHPGIRHLRASVEALLSDSPEATVEEVNSHVLQQATEVFPAVRNQGRVVPWQSPTVALSVKGMWQAYHCWRHGPTTGHRNVFALWRAYSAFRRAHKQFRQRTREAKRAWFHDQILGMERASAAGDVRALFRLAGALMPKQPRRKLQLRGPNGELWSSTQQVDCLKTFFQDLYAPEDEPALPPLPPLQAPTISSSEAHRRLTRLPVHKATPAHQAPTAAIVACADLLAPWLSDKVESLSSFPAVWSDCWLALMPKVSHPVLPRQLRPIGLTESTSRVLAGHLQDALKPYLQAFVGPWPQLAYMAGRSTGEALHRVFSHCHEVSAANLKPAYNIHRARDKLAQAGTPSSHQSASKRQRTGGVQASLDLSQAFDRLSWSLIHEALLEAQVPIELRVQLLEFYRGLGYHLTFGSEQATVHALRGVKQGCKVAPLLWSLATGLLMRRLARATSSEWVRRALTAFADDFHIGQVVYSTRDLLLSIDRLGHVLQLLIDARMKVNIDKSVILLSVNHSYANRWRRREILSDKEGPRLRISTPTAGTFKMPIVSTHKYLGAIISYQEDCTQLTVAYRLRQTWATWTRLRPALTSASAPALPLRLRLWQACIPPTALYALDSLPLQQQHLVQIQRALTKQLRAVAKSQAHLTGESTVALHHRLRVPFVLDALRQASHRRAARWAAIPPEEAHLLNRSWQTRIDEALQKLDSPLQPLLDAPTASSVSPALQDKPSTTGAAESGMHEEGWSCPHCSYQAPSHRLLRVHLSRTHASKAKDRERPGRFNRDQHSVSGMPTCRLCGHRFSRWSGLRCHIDKGHCRCLSFSALPEPEPTTTVPPNTATHPLLPHTSTGIVPVHTEAGTTSATTSTPGLEPSLLEQCLAAHPSPDLALSSAPSGALAADATTAAAEDTSSIRPLPVSQSLAYTPAFQTRRCSRGQISGAH